MASAAPLIDAGFVSFTLSGYLGGFLNQDDNAVLIVTFKRNAQVLGATQIGPVTAADRADATGLFPRSAFGLVPRGTSQILVTLQMTRATGTYNDGYADNLSLTLGSLIGSNLIANPGAELGPGSADGFTVEPVPGWTTSGNFTVAQYGDGTNGLPSTTGPGPSSRGSNLFAGGPANSLSSASQSISVAAAAPLVDAGLVTFSLAGYLGGFFNQEDDAVLTITFLNNTRILGSAQIGPVTAADRGDITGLLPRSTSGLVPIGTRQILVTLVMTKGPDLGTYNDGYADNLGLVLGL